MNSLRRSTYDEGFPESERLPRSFTIRFHPYVRDGLHHVAMYLGDETVGDPLNDNAYVDDYYRFHDAFHLACAAVLGWSPILRQLLRRKRKQDADIDRVEDGARAQAIEEGLSAYVFTVARRFDFFEATKRVDWELLKTVRRMTDHLEVHDQSPVAWQRMILEAYEVWRALIEHDGGDRRGQSQRTYAPVRAVWNAPRRLAGDERPRRGRTAARRPTGVSLAGYSPMVMRAVPHDPLDTSSVGTLPLSWRNLWLCWAPSN